MDVNFLLFILLQGLILGALVALVAVGYTLIYGVIGLINFAHGEFLMVAAYAAFGVYTFLPEDTHPLIGLLIIFPSAAIAGGMIAVITEWVAYKPIRKAGRLAALLTAIGVSFLLQEAFRFVNNGSAILYDVKGPIGGLNQKRMILDFLPGETYKIPYTQLAFVPLSVVLVLIAWYIVQCTRFGKAMRAVAQDADAAALMGIDVDSVARKTFLLGGILAGVGGAISSIAFGMSPTMGFLPGLKAFIAAVIGGIGSIPGAFLGAYVIGLTEAFLQYFGLSRGQAEIAVFGLLVIMLLVRPQGLLGKVKREKV